MENKSLFTPKEGAYTKRDSGTRIENKKLHTLIIAHYVAGVIGVIVSCFALSKSGLGMEILNNTESITELELIMQKVFGWFYVVSGIILFITGEILSVSLIVSAHFMKRNVAHLFSIIVAAASCIVFPIGTALGIITIITLSDTSIKELYSKKSGH